MRNDKKLNIIGLALMSTLVLSGCSFFQRSSSTKKSSAASTSGALTSENASSVAEESSEDDSEIINPINKTKFNYNYKDYAKHCYLNYDFTPSVGSPKLLVIPVWFTDSESCIHPLMIQLKPLRVAEMLS